ncbi:hypothetical protein D3C85_1703700 [compost metagenome]
MRSPNFCNNKSSILSIDLRKSANLSTKASLVDSGSRTVKRSINSLTAAGVNCCLASVQATDGSKCDSIIKPCISKSNAF